jgi:internalin A
MGRTSPYFIRAAFFLAVIAVIAAGCRRINAPLPAVAVQGDQPDDPFLRVPEGEDPDVVAYVKKKGWEFWNDYRIRDHRPLVVLNMRREPLSDDDYKMIARSKRVQYIDLSRVECTDRGIQALARMTQLGTIFVNGDDVTDAGVKALSRCQSLEVVALSCMNVTEAGVKELAALPNLRRLSLGLMTFRGDGLEVFAGSKTLRAVGLSSVKGFTDRGARALAKLPNLDELAIDAWAGQSQLTTAGLKTIVAAHVPTSFEFDEKLIDDDLLESLVAKGWLYGPTLEGAVFKKPASAEEVRTIALNGSKVTDRGLVAVLHCMNVESLYLERTAVTDLTLKNISGFRKLSHIELEKTRVTAAGLDAICGLPITYLGLGGCELSEDAFKAVGKMGFLEELSLDAAKMNPEWLRHIASLTKLRKVNLMRTAFDDVAAKRLAATPGLEDLTLNGTRLGDDGFRALLTLPRLTSLSVDGTNVSKEVYRNAKREHPALRLYYHAYDK